MRLRSLNLERYGAFTGRCLTFREGARLHVVLGANEAGKSTALVAVADLLFGFEKSTPYAFLHEMPDLRVGAEIVSREGRQLSFRRRKGNRNTLIDAGDAALPEDALANFLHGLSRQVFCRAFGLDARSLREGGNEMLDAQGEVGASLFAAASGLRGYRQLQGRLEEEAAEIFAPRAAKHRRFYQALERFETARKEIRDKALRSGEWRELNDEIAAAAARLDVIRADRAGIAAERARLERLKRVLPLIAAIDEGETHLPVEDGLPEMQETAVTRLGQCIARQGQAAEAQARAEAALAEAERALAAVPVDSGLVARAEEIFEAFRGIDRFDKDGIDLPRIEKEAEGFSATLETLAIRVGLGDVEALQKRQPSDATRARMDGLIREGREAVAAIARLSADLGDRKAEQARLSAGQGDGGLVDPGPLRADLKAFAGMHGEVAKRDALDATIRRESAQVRMQAARLLPPVADLPALIGIGLPSPEVIARFRQRLDTLEREKDRAADHEAASTKALSATETQLRKLAAGRPIPSRAELDDLRFERDRLLLPLRAAALGAGAGSQAEAALYDAAVARADQAADALASDAARVAEQSTALARRDAQAADLEAAQARLSEGRERLAEALADWGRAWQAAGFIPGNPAEMALWLGEVEGLIDTHQVLQEQGIERDGLSHRIEACRLPLAALARRAGLADLDGLDVGASLTRIEDHVAGLGARWDTARERQARSRAIADDVARIADMLEAARAREEAWRGQWSEAIAALALRERAGPDEAAAALEAWRAVPVTLTERDNRLSRVAGIRRDMDAYAAAVSRLCAEHAPDLGALPTTAAMKALQARLQTALNGESRRRELAKLRDTAAQTLTEAVQTAEAARTALSEILAGLDGAFQPAEAAALHERLVARAIARTALTERRAELARAADGIGEAELRADLSGLPVEAIDAALQAAAAQDEDLDHRGKLAFADRDRFTNRRTELEGGVGAETAHAERKAAEAELQAEARQWAVLKFANLMLGTAIARHRAGQQDPLLERAGGLFSGLTGGGFAGLAQDYGESDEPRIVGRRTEGGGLVPVDGLSEGTRDQLYLALRLAYLEDYASRSEPAPFIGDDLFSTFDDARTGYGLEALAAIGGNLQPILFTHHRHVAELARQRLGEQVDIVNL